MIGAIVLKIYRYTHIETACSYNSCFYVTVPAVASFSLKVLEACGVKQAAILLMETRSCQSRTKRRLAVGTSRMRGMLGIPGIARKATASPTYPSAGTNWFYFMSQIHKTPKNNKIRSQNTPINILMFTCLAVQLGSYEGLEKGLLIMDMAKAALIARLLRWAYAGWQPFSDWKRIHGRTRHAGTVWKRAARRGQSGGHFSQGRRRLAGAA